MTGHHRHQQLHLFERRCEPTLPAETHQRVLTLVIALLDEASCDARPRTEPVPATEAGNE